MPLRPNATSPEEVVTVRLPEARVAAVGVKVTGIVMVAFLARCAGNAGEGAPAVKTGLVVDTALMSRSKFAVSVTCLIELCPTVVVGNEVDEPASGAVTGEPKL